MGTALAHFAGAEKETLLEQIINSSLAARYSIAFLAVFFSGLVMLAADMLVVLGYDAEHAADRAGVVQNRTVGKGVMGFPPISVALEKQQKRFVTNSPSGLQY